MKRKPGPGGARPGAGRPALGETVTLQVRLLRKTRDRLRALPQPMGASVREAVEEWLEKQPDSDR